MALAKEGIANRLSGAAKDVFKGTSFSTTSLSDADKQALQQANNAWTEMQTQIATNYSQYTKTIEEQYECMVQTMEEPLKDEEAELEDEKTALEAELKMAEKEVEFAKKMFEEGVKNMFPNYSS